MVRLIDYIENRLSWKLESNAPTDNDQNIYLHLIVVTALAAWLKISSMNTG